MIHDRAPRQQVGSAPPHARRPLSRAFTAFANATAHAVGTPWAFLVAVAIVALWAGTGPLFGFSDTWQLVINTGTTIVTFLMVFLIQHTQNRDARAMHLKLDELLRAVERARTELIDVEEDSDEQLDSLARDFRALRERAGPAGPGAPPP
jgi:low affinity Fe/Cu permease